MSKTAAAKDGTDDLAMFACPNPDCNRFNQFDAGNLCIVEWMGKNKSIRRLYCNHCQHRFSERQGSLMQYTKLPEPTVVRIVKCLGHGCSIEATADICEVDPRSVQRMLDRAGKRAEDFHRLQLESPVEAKPSTPQGVELDELHGRVWKNGPKKGSLAKAVPWPIRSRMGGGMLDAIADWVETGFTRLWR
jgi:transposase-like protein